VTFSVTNSIWISLYPSWLIIIRIGPAQIISHIIRLIPFGASTFGYAHLFHHLQDFFTTKNVRFLHFYSPTDILSFVSFLPCSFLNPVIFGINRCFSHGNKWWICCDYDLCLRCTPMRVGNSLKFTLCSQSRLHPLLLTFGIKPSQCFKNIWE